MVKVYSYGGSRARRVFWALEEMGVSYEVETVKFPPRLHQPEFLEINPSGAVPAMVDGHVVLYESLAICEYLARKHGSDLVVQPDELDFPTYLQFLHFGEGTLAPPISWAFRFGRGEDAMPRAVEEARTMFTIRLRAVERALADGREFLASGRLTLADLSIMYVLGLSAGAANLHDCLPAKVQAYEARLKTRPAYQRAYAV